MRAVRKLDNCITKQTGLLTDAAFNFHHRDTKIAQHPACMFAQGFSATLYPGYVDPLRGVIAR